MNHKITIKEQLIPLPNITLNVAIGGNEKGKPILLLHGYPDAWFGWEKVMQELIEKGFRVIAPDQRGYNLSSKPKGIKSYYTDNLIQDAIDLMTHLGYEKFHLAGHDYGGYIAWIIASNFSNKISKLLIISGLHPTVLSNIRKFKLGWTQAVKSWYLSFFKLKSIPEWFLRKNDFEFLFVNHSKSLNTAERERYRKIWSQPSAIESMINWYRVPSLKIEKPFLKMPVLIIWGEKDLYLTTKAAEACLEYCPKGKLEIIKNGSHWLMLEETESIVKEMTTFFE